MFIAPRRNRNVQENSHHPQLQDGSRLLREVNYVIRVKLEAATKDTDDIERLRKSQRDRRIGLLRTW